jgi:hypothetical protein
MALIEGKTLTTAGRHPSAFLNYLCLSVLICGDLAISRSFCVHFAAKVFEHSGEESEQ